MAAFAGFDAYACPNPLTLGWLKARTDLTWLVFYLGGAPSHPDKSFMGQRAALVAGGWGLAPVYVGEELDGPGSHLVTAAQGKVDGAQAAVMMRLEGFAPESWVYLDIETPAATGPQAAYISAWAAAVTGAGYSPGVYCSHVMAEAAAKLAAIDGKPPRIFAYRIAVAAAGAMSPPFSQEPPAGSGYPGAFAWQHAQGALIPCGGPRPLSVDLSTALTADPSAP